MSAVSTDLFAKWANQYRDTGFNPVPIRPGSKSPAPARWQTGRQEDETFRLWLDQYKDHGIGVLLGTPLEAVLTGGAELRGQFLIAVDVDQDDRAEPVRHALRVHENALCAKRGPKGITYFARGDQEQKNTNLRRRLEDGRYQTLVEILATGSQTVIPPTIHPDTKAPYEWKGTPLLTARMRDLPEVNDSVMDELLSVCEGGIRSEHFDELRNMGWAGVGGGGNTRDTCASAVASLVARGWTDTQIHERIEFATKEACIRAGMEYDWPDSSRAIQEWIDSARKKGMDDAAAKQSATTRVMAAVYIEELGEHRAVSLGRGILRYQDGHWSETGVDPLELERVVMEKFAAIDVLAARRVIDTVVSLLHRNGEDFGNTEAARHMVCTPSGTLDARTLVMERWAPEHQLFHQTRADYQEDAACPRYERFLSGMFNGDGAKIDTLEEFFGWTFVQDTSFHKALFIVGPSGIGKSTLTSLLEAIHGAQATSNVALYALSDPRNRAPLLGRLVNISSEKSQERDGVSDAFKKIVAGEIVKGKILFKDLFYFRPYARLIATVNEMPTMSDYAGLARRVLPLHCVKPFVPTSQERDRDLLQALLAERNGVCFNRLLARGRFQDSEVIEADIEEYMQESAGLTARWVRECCAPATSPKDYASNDALWNAYDVWTLCAGRHTDRHTSIIPWGKTMTRLGYPAVNARRGHDYIKARKLMLKSSAPTRHEGPDPNLTVAAS